MEFKTLLEKRRSVRKFAPTAVPSEVVDRLLAETLGAPSSRNSRSTRLLVVDDPEVVARMASMRDYGSAFMKGAPLAIVVLGDTACSDLWRINAAISATVRRGSSDSTATVRACCECSGVCCRTSSAGAWDR